jgi:hypothetical protein
MSLDTLTVDIIVERVEAAIGALTVLEHNNLDGLQGGISSERYHFTEAQYTEIVNIVGGVLADILTIALDTTGGITPEPGQMAWDPEAGTLILGMPSGEAILQFGQEQYINMRNDTGSDVGQPAAVYISGAIGNIPTLALASSSNTFPDEGAIGLTTETIENNTNGKVTTFGRIKNVDTSLWSVRDRLFVSSTPGVLTTTIPSGTDRKIFVGEVLRSHPTQGVIFCLIINILFPGELSGDPPTVTGSISGDLAGVVTNLLTALDNREIIDDQTTA